MPTCLSADRQLEVLAAAGDQLAARAERAGVEAPVPTCPEWTVEQLVAHQGTVHRWAAAKLLGEDVSILPSQQQSLAEQPDIVALVPGDARRAARGVRRALRRRASDGVPARRPAAACVLGSGQRPVTFVTPLPVRPQRRPRRDTGDGDRCRATAAPSTTVGRTSTSRCASCPPTLPAAAGSDRTERLWLNRPPTTTLWDHDATARTSPESAGSRPLRTPPLRPRRRAVTPGRRNLGAHRDLPNGGHQRPPTRGQVRGEPPVGEMAGALVTARVGLSGRASGGPCRHFVWHAMLVG